MSIEYEERVASHDPSLYERIGPYVLFIPDFRPQETLQQMKKIMNPQGEMVPEPQNTWRLIYQELADLNYNKVHEKFLNTVLANDFETFKAYFTDDILLEEISLTYPVFTFLLSKIHPSEITWAFYISQGIYLAEIPWKNHYITYITNIKVANKVYGLYGDTVTQNSLEEIIKENADIIGPMGGIYWLLLYYENLYDKYYRIINSSIIRGDRIDLAKSLINRKRSEATDNIVTDHLIYYGSRTMLDYYMDRLLSLSSIKDLLEKSAQNGHEYAFMKAFSKLGKDKKYLLHLLPAALEGGNHVIIKFMLEETEESLSNDTYMIERFASVASLSTLDLVLTHLDVILLDSPALFYEDLFHSIIKIRRYDLFRYIIESDTPRNIEDLIDYTLTLRDIKALKIIIKYGDIEKWRYNGILRTALARRDINMISLILKYADNIPLNTKLKEKAINMINR